MALTAENIILEEFREKFTIPYNALKKIYSPSYFTELV